MAFKPMGCLGALLCGVIICSFFSVSTAIAWDPCAPPVPVKKGDNFTVGLLFIAGADAVVVNQVIGNATNGVCSPEVQAYLVQNFNTRVAIFNPILDRLTAMSIPYPDVIFNMVNNTDQTTEETFVVVAFRGNITSPGAYMVSANPALTNGTGFVISLALLVRMSIGELRHLQWYDQTCNECGGRSSPLCIKTPAALSSPDIYSCTTALGNCTCGGEANCSFADARFDICSTAINLAWDGEDSRSSAFRTGAQLKRINAFSLTSLFMAGRDKLFNFYYDNVATSWGQLTSDVNAQYVDFSGGLGNVRRRLGL